jgi:hypothetical protein
MRRQKTRRAGISFRVSFVSKQRTLKSQTYIDAILKT